MGSLWNRSGMVERYADDLRATGAKAFFFQGGTTSTLTVFRDSGESSAHSNPVVADANGRWPDVFVPYVISYDVQVKSKDDVQLTYSLQIPNPNPVDLTVIVPPEEKIQTGMIHGEMVNTTKPGFVRLNGRTIGNPASLATERANADTSALFTYLWNNVSDTIAPVSTGRGSSAVADFNANKNIGLPDARGTGFIGLDDMGNTAANAFAGLAFGVGSAILAGSTTGENSVTLSSTQMPAHAHTGTTSSDGAHTHTGSGTTSDRNVGHSHVWGGDFTTSGQSIDHTHQYGSGALGGVTGGGGAIGAGGSQTTSGVNTDHSHGVSVGGTTGGENTGHTHTYNFTTSGVSTLHSHTFTTSTVGGTTPINNIPLSRLVTWFIKL